MHCLCHLDAYSPPRPKHLLYRPRCIVQALLMHRFCPSDVPCLSLAKGRASKICDKVGDPNGSRFTLQKRSHRIGEASQDHRRAQGIIPYQSDGCDVSTPTAPPSPSNPPDRWEGVGPANKISPNDSCRKPGDHHHRQRTYSW